MINLNMTMADYYNERARLQKEGKAEYPVTLYIHEYDDILEKLTLKDLMKAAYKYWPDDPNYNYYKLPDNVEVFNAIFSMDTETRHVFWRVIKAVKFGIWTL